MRHLQHPVFVPLVGLARLACLVRHPMLATQLLCPALLLVPCPRVALFQPCMPPSSKAATPCLAGNPPEAAEAAKRCQAALLEAVVVLHLHLSAA